jgi:hypothetical protein
MSDNEVKIDLIGEMSDGSWVMILVEEGPWDHDELVANLRRIQALFHNCVDVAIDGYLAKLYPKSKGKPAVVRLDCYDTPDGPVRKFVDRFAAHVRDAPDIQRDLKSKGFVASLRFEYSWDTLQDAG